ncbi:hypothetical protein ACTXT7_006378 [Hymenolepis weldensis]
MWAPGGVISPVLPFPSPLSLNPLCCFARESGKKRIEAVDDRVTNYELVTVVTVVNC